MQEERMYLLTKLFRASRFSLVAKKILPKCLVAHACWNGHGPVRGFWGTGTHALDDRTPFTIICGVML